MEIQGRVKQIGSVQTFGSGFQKRELVIVTEEQYPQPILIEFTQGNCALLDSVATGELVKVSINLRGREWTNPEGEVKYFNSIQGWRIEKFSTTVVSAGASNTPPAGQPDFGAYPTVQPTATSDMEDDLPF